MMVLLTERKLAGLEAVGYQKKKIFNKYTRHLLCAR